MSTYRRAMHRVETDAAASDLADRLNGARRDRPIVVVTTPSGHGEPWIDAAKIERHVGDLAEVFIMPTGQFTWSFSNKMPAMTQVFGGAGRVYPVGHEWANNPKRSPLRFAYNAAEGSRATDQLIDDAMTMAAMAGLSANQTKVKRTHLAGVVVGVVADRALVKLANRRLGNVSAALAVPGVPIESLLTVGQEVIGWFEEGTSWLDVREMALAPENALSGYGVNDVVLAEVGDVAEATAELFLHPLVPVDIGRDQVTGNDVDDLRTLLTPGEVVAARVTAPGPTWQLSMIDIDDDEEPVPAASLLRDGPPWLVPPPLETPALLSQPAHVPEELDPVLPAAPPSEQAADPTPHLPPVPHPSPRLLDPRRREREKPKPGPDRQPLVSEASDLRSERAERDALREELDGYRQEVRLLRQQRASSEARIHHLERQLADQRSRLRKARRPTAASPRPVFADAELGFRHAVTAAWATRTPVGEQAAVPLPDFRIGEPFLDSLARLEGISVDKVADVVFEIVTGRAKGLASRELHQYRESPGAGAPAVQRAADGAVLWRANLQTKTASARRIHYWQLPGEVIELWHVGTHDEPPPL